MCVSSANHTPQCTVRHTCSCIGYERMETFHICYPCAVGLQAFQSATAFNANIGAWNTARATTLSYVSAFSAVACNLAMSCTMCLFVYVCT